MLLIKVVPITYDINASEVVLTADVPIPTGMTVQLFLINQPLSSSSTYLTHLLRPTSHLQPVSRFATIPHPLLSAASSVKHASLTVARRLDCWISQQYSPDGAWQTVVERTVQVSSNSLSSIYQTFRS